jgi:hypothetical protein
MARELLLQARAFPIELGRIGQVHERATAACTMCRTGRFHTLGGSREHDGKARPCLALGSVAVDGYMSEANPHTLTRQPAHDVHAQGFASRNGLRQARAVLVEGRACHLEFVARPKLLI